jgi:hypothetical protein
MFKLRIVFILSLAILAALAVSTVYFLPSGESYVESKKLKIIAEDTEWILPYDILNRDEQDKQYAMEITVDGAIYHDETTVKKGKYYTYLFHIQPEQLVAGNVGFTVYEQGKAVPVDQATFQIECE